MHEKDSEIPAEHGSKFRPLWTEIFVSDHLPYMGMVGVVGGGVGVVA